MIFMSGTHVGSLGRSIDSNLEASGAHSLLLGLLGSVPGVLWAAWAVPGSPE